MTKQLYLDMCEQLGSEPNPNEIPVEFTDLPHEVQVAYEVFNYLPDRIDGFSGIYLGKDISGLGVVMDILQVDDRRHTLYFMKIIADDIARHIEAKRPKNVK